jgi:hypothetical protein
MKQASEQLKLTDAARYVFEECRMVLPGIQALFGFQMISVFNQGFAQKLDPFQQKLHGVAIVFVVAAIGLIMAPAALHRRAERDSVSERFVQVASRLVLSAMLLLAIALSLDIFIVAIVVWHDQNLAIGISIVSLGFFLTLWELYPAIYRRSNT